MVAAIGTGSVVSVFSVSSLPWAPPATGASDPSSTIGGGMAFVAASDAICGFLRSVEKTNKNSFLLVTQNYYTQDSKLVRDTN